MANPDMDLFSGEKPAELVNRENRRPWQMRRPRDSSSPTT